MPAHSGATARPRTPVVGHRRPRSAKLSAGVALELGTWRISGRTCSGAPVRYRSVPASWDDVRSGEVAFAAPGDTVGEQER